MVVKKVSLKCCHHTGEHSLSMYFFFLLGTLLIRLAKLQNIGQVGLQPSITGEKNATGSFIVYEM